MGHTLIEWQTKVAELVRDAGNVDFTPAQLATVGIQPALAQFSTDRPRVLVTEVPGPKSRALVERSAAALTECMSLHLTLFVDRCEGALLTDVDGNTFIDWAGGVGCLDVGHVKARGSADVIARSG